MREALRRHWPEYLMEAAGLGLFMLSACLFGTLLEHPGSPLRGALPDPLVRRVLMGLAMGLTAVGIVYSPWGQQSGAHVNPAVTLTFLRLGRVPPADAAFYVAAQFAGGLAGVVLSGWLLGGALADPTVAHVVTVPGAWGGAAAFGAEALISFLLMSAVLELSAAPPAAARLTGLAAGALVALYIALEAPVSGMSMNPARTAASALPAGDFRGLWIYFTAPLAGMLAAGELHARRRGRASACAKLHHDNPRRCIFCGQGVRDAAPLQEAA